VSTSAVSSEPPRALAGTPREATRAHEPPWVAALSSRALAFAALALLAGVRFAALLTHAPVLRVAGVACACATAGAALAATARLRHGGSRARLFTAASAALRLAILALATYVALLAAGASAAHALPWHWGRLVDEVTSGLNALDGRWPYAGGVAHARLAVMLAVPAVVVPAAALAFWPGARRGGARRACALALLLGMYATAAINEPRGAWQVQGALLLALLCAWAWAWRSRPLDPLRAFAWALAGGLAALLLAGALDARSPLLHYRAWDPFGPAYPATSFDWNQTFGPLRWPNTNEVMVEVAARAPRLWRATTLDEFDGTGFVRSRAAQAAAAQDGLRQLDPRWVERVSFAVRGLRSAELLSPGEILYAALEGEGLSHLRPIASDGTVRVSAAPPPSGDRYTITAYAPRPSAAELRAAPDSFPAAYARYTRFALPLARGHVRGTGPSVGSSELVRRARTGARETILVSGADAALVEASPYARVYGLARGLAAGASSEYEVVARTLAFLHRGFAYSEAPPLRAYPLAAFLLRDRRGFCQQFAGAMALMLRMDGVPARVAAGFLPGSRSAATGLYSVTAHDAHSWVEVYFPSFGWVAFDPTPPAPALTGDRARAGDAGASGRPQGSAPATVQGAAARSRGRAARSRPRGGSGALATAAIVLASLLAVGMIAALLASRARVRRGFAGDAEGAVRELARAFAALGAPLGTGVTLMELERRLKLSREPRAARYVRLLRERRYSPAGVGVPALPTRRDRRLLRKALRARRGPLARVRALYALPPG
jgi:protein-glutamine gamma-glutamyltransferase